MRREWLEKNHTSETEAWLVINKKKFEAEGLSLGEAVEDALCYGWIDGTLRSLDERQYLLRFSPRRPNSIWSMTNIRRAEKLIDEGKMRDAGAKKIAEAKENGEWEAAKRRERVNSIPRDLETALRKVKGALYAYRSLPNSRKKQFIFWLQRAKREETKEKRIRKILEEVINQRQDKMS